MGGHKIIWGGICPPLPPPGAATDFVNMRAFSIFRCEIINNIPGVFRVAFIFKKTHV